MAALAGGGGPDLLFLAFHNLIDNAFKFSAAGATVEIRALEDGANVAVEVADTGPGIEDDDIAHLGDYAVWFGLLNRALAGEVGGGGLRLLWLTPMRALAADTARALEAPLAQLGLDWKVGVRTGDTEAGERTRQSQRLPEALVTTPESLTLLLTRPDSPGLLGGVELVVVDEWHELMGNKRGVQLQLALARLRMLARQRAGDDVGLPRLEAGASGFRLASEMPAEPGAPASAPVERGGGPEGPAAQLPRCGACPRPSAIPSTRWRCCWPAHRACWSAVQCPRKSSSTPCCPTSRAAFPGAGISGSRWSSRSHARSRLPPRRWSSPIHARRPRSGTSRCSRARPKWAGLIALHHGSLDKEVREWVERGLKEGRLKAVVATSSLDLGVDFLPVERVLQIGSPKGVARLLQRAGRSGHAPGRPSRVTIVPTHTLELVEAAAARSAVAAGRVESRRAPEKPLDVLVQHLVTLALGTGFRERRSTGRDPRCVELPRA